MSNKYTIDEFIDLGGKVKKHELIKKENKLLSSFNLLWENDFVIFSKYSNKNKNPTLEIIFLSVKKSINNLKPGIWILR